MAIQSPVDERFNEAARYVQEGSWGMAVSLLKELQKEFPGQEETILPLLEHVEMKARMDRKRVRGRTALSLFFTRRRIVTFVVVALVIGVLVGGWSIYQRIVLPAQVQHNQMQQIEALLGAGQDALNDADYGQARDRFIEVLKIDAEQPTALEGLDRADRYLELNALYSQGLETLRQGESEAALELFLSIQEQEPGYRDTERLIRQIRSGDALIVLFSQAEELFAQGEWAEAIPLYNEVRESDISFESATVEENLFVSYISLAEDLSHTSGLTSLEIDGVIQLYRQGLSLRPRERILRQKEQLLSTYQQGLVLSDNGEYGTAVTRFHELYEEDPALLGGDVVAALYDARLGYGLQLQEKGNLWGAMAQYLAASDLPLDDVSEAKLRARTVGLALTPTATPTATVTPTPTPDPVSLVTKLLPPTPSPIENHMGWIAFKSDRPHGGRGGLWAMPPSGGEPVAVTDPNGLYEHIQQQVRWSNDGMRRIWVESDGSQSSVSIWMWRYDIPKHWLDARTELYNNSGTNYDVSYSPDNESVVFTSQRPKGPPGASWGDEIFIFNFADFNDYGHVIATRLTNNDWEWDKHPTFSPDGQQIAFWSNRGSGMAQIWIMNRDGSNQRNISNSEWNDWDPVFIIERRELPEHADEDEDEIGPLFDPAKDAAN